MFSSSMPDPSTIFTVAQLGQMLHGVLNATDNHERRAIEAVVVRSLSQPQNLLELVHLLCGASSETSAGVRQLAAVLLRKKIFSLWKALSAAMQAELKQVLLQRLGEEPERRVRFAIAHLMSRLAKADAGAGQGGWLELQRAIRVASEDPRAAMRELAMVLIYSFAEVFSEENALGGLASEAVVRGLMDEDGTVQKAAVKATMALLPSVGDNPTVRNGLLRDLVPNSLGLLTRYAREPPRASLCMSVLELIGVLIEELSAKKHAGLLVEIAKKLLGVMADSTTVPRVREGCSLTLSELATQKPKFVVAQSLLQPFVDACVRLMAEDATISLPENDHVEEDDDGDDTNNATNAHNSNDVDHNIDPNDDDDDDDDDDAREGARSPCMIGGHLLSCLAAKIPSKPFTAALLPFVSATVAAPDAVGPFVKKSCALALACLAEGSPSYLRRRVGYVLDLMQQFLADVEPTPREAAGFALRAFALHLQPEILTHHARLVPLLGGLLATDAGDPVRRRVAEALDALCENLAEELEPYVGALMPVVTAALEREGTSLETQTALCGVIASVAATRCVAFKPFAPALLAWLRQPLAARAPELLALRAQATETAGVVGAALGKEAFAPYVDAFLQSVAENLSLGSAVLREHSFGFLSNLSEILREDFLPYLEDALTAALHTIEEDTATYTNKHPLASAEVPLVLEDDLNGTARSGGAAQDPAEDNDSNDEDNAEEIHMRVRTADVEEKSSALYSMGVFAEVLRGHFGMPRVERCWEAISRLEGHFYPNVRSNSMIACAKLLKAAHGAIEVNQSQTEDTLEARTRELLDDFIHHLLLDTLHNELDKEVFSAACEAMEIVLKFFGPQCFPFGPDVLVRECIEVLRQKKGCILATDFDPEDSEQDDVDGEDELFSRLDPSAAGAWRDVISPEMVLRGVRLSDDHNEVLDATVDVLEALAQAYGASFAPYADYLVPLLALYTDPEMRPSEDLVMATGTLAMLLVALGRDGIAERHVEQLIPIAFRVLRGSDDSAARGNSCYLLRVLLEVCPGRFHDAAAVQETLQALWEVVSHGAMEEIPQAVDNAVSATCSLVRCLPPSLVPLQTIMPNLLPYIPMRLEKAENANALETLVFLFTNATEQTAAAAWLPALVSCVATVLCAHTVEDGEKANLIQAGVKGFIAKQPQLWQQACAMAELNGDQQEALRAAGVLC